MGYYHIDLWLTMYIDNRILNLLWCFGENISKQFIVSHLNYVIKYESEGILWKKVNFTDVQSVGIL